MVLMINFEDDNHFLIYSVDNCLDDDVCSTFVCGKSSGFNLYKDFVPCASIMELLYTVLQDIYYYYDCAIVAVHIYKRSIGMDQDECLIYVCLLEVLHVLPPLKEVAPFFIHTHHKSCTIQKHNLSEDSY